MTRVRNWRPPLVEKTQFITPDGEVFELHTNYRGIITRHEGWGLPVPSISETSGPFQHGTTVTAIREQPRKVVMTRAYFGKNRDKYWSERTNLVNALRRNRADLNNPEPGSLRRYLSTGEIRQLDVFCTKGPQFKDVRRTRDPHTFEEQIEFIAFNPIIYDPTQITSNTVDFECTPAENLSFPVSIGAGSGIIFGGESCSTTISPTISYDGNWEEYPTIEIGGPATNPIIINQGTGKRLELDYTIGATEVVTFNLTYGIKEITNQNGDSLLARLVDSDLALFSLQPDPIVADGDNNIKVTISDGTADTYIAIKYFNRYIGI